MSYELRQVMRIRKCKTVNCKSLNRKSHKRRGRFPNWATSLCHVMFK